MKIAIFGNKESTKLIASHLIGNYYNIDTLITLSSEQKERTEISGVCSDIEGWAIGKEIKIYKPSSYKLNSIEDFEWFDNEKFEIGICLGWQRLIPKKILSTFSMGVFGWHGSGFEFPNGRGRSPINWSIRLGLGKIYHNCFRYNSDVDKGEIFDTKVIMVKDNDYISGIQKKALEHIKNSSLKLIHTASNGSINLRRQSLQSYILFPKLSEIDGWLQPTLMSVKTAVNIVRSCSRPFPGAYILIINENVKIRIWKLTLSQIKESTNLELAVGEMKILSGEILQIQFLDGVAISNDFEILSSSKIFSNERRYDCESTL